MKTRFKLKGITMLNPENKVIIVTNDAYRHKWEQLGFIVANNVILMFRPQEAQNEQRHGNPGNYCKN